MSPGAPRRSRLSQISKRRCARCSATRVITTCPRRRERGSGRSGSTAGVTALADDTQWLDATAHAELVAGGDVKPVELVDAAIERVERLDGDINAVIMRW